MRGPLAAAAADELQHPHEAAYCRFRQAEAILLTRGSRLAAQAAAQEAHRIASNLGAVPLQRDVERLAVRSRLDLASRPVAAERPRAPRRPAAACPSG